MHSLPKSRPDSSQDHDGPFPFFKAVATLISVGTAAWLLFAALAYLLYGLVPG